MNWLFKSALARLTMLYVVVLAAVCLLFSSYIYTLASNEIDQTSRRQVVGFRGALGRFILDEDQTEILRKSEADDARARLRTKLVFGNITVIALGALLSYQFAKKTLEPIEEMVQAQERFTSDASHELRTPLASMRTEIEVALKDKAITKKEAVDILSSNLEEVLTLQAMTDNLLSLARSRELGEKQATDVDKVIRKLVKKYEPIMRKAGIKLESKVDKACIQINADVLQQLLSILLDNSAKYAGRGSLVKLIAQLSDNSYRVVVQDNGVGIGEHELESVFDRFYKTDTSRTNSRSLGHGLGLSIARQLASALGGSIRAHIPDGGKGIAFEVTIPVL